MEPTAPPAAAPTPLPPASTGEIATAPPPEPPLDTQQLGAEALLATVGLHAFLTRDPQADGRVQPIRVTQEVHKRALGLPFRWRDEIRAFLRAKDWAEPAERDHVDGWDFDRVADALVREQTPEDLAARLDLGDADMTLALTMAAGTALTTVREVFAPRATQTLLGAEPAKPSDMELCRLRLVWGAVDDPHVILRDMAAGRLSRRQVDAFRRSYPALAGFLDQVVTTEAANLRADKPGADLDRRRQMQLAVLMGMAAPNPELAKQLQANLRAPDAGVVPGQGPAKPPADKPLAQGKPMDSTATQQIAGG